MRYIYTDGACSGNGYYGARAGVGVWFGPNHPNNISRPVTGSPTNQRAELEAVADALNAIPPHEQCEDTTICTDSAYVIRALHDWIPRWKRNGWKTARGQHVKHKELFQQVSDRLALLAAEQVKVAFRKVKGHSGDKGNDGADFLAKEGATWYTPQEERHSTSCWPRMMRLGSQTWVRVDSSGRYRECVNQ